LLGGQETTQNATTTPWRKSGYLTLLPSTRRLLYNLAQLHVGSNIKYEFIAKKGEVQLWLFHLATQHPQSHPESEHELIRVVSLCSLGESVGSMLTHPGSRLHRRIVLSDNSLWSCRNKQEWI